MPFNQWGGRYRADALFGPELPPLLEQLNQALIAVTKARSDVELTFRITLSIIGREH